MLNRIINIGYSDELPTYLQNRVQPTNTVALLLLFAVGIPFLVLTPMYFPLQMALVPLSGSLSCIGVLLGNYFGGIRYTRPMISLVGVTTGILYNLFLCGPGDDPIPSVYVVTIAFSLVPFVTMDAREKGFLIFISIFSFAGIVGFPLTRSWFTIEADTTIIREGWMAYVTTALSVITAIGCMVGLIEINKKAELKMIKANQDAEDRHQKLLLEQEENNLKTQELELAQAKERKRQWAAEGIAQISEIVRHTGSEDNLFDQLVSTTVKYLNANQGGLFVVDRSKEAVSIQLAACYAYERKKYINKTIYPGEGLIGQTYLEAEYLHFTEIPEDYVKITSGLGKATPTALVIMPLKVNEEVEGVLELASFKPFEDHEITFLERLGEVMAAYIQNQRVMQQTHYLLEQAQEQGEEMRAQEEEMRQNMEELQATQEEMHRKEREYQIKIKQLEQKLPENS
ncbi:MAG: GAF domain-containing protein [Bacteroidota bacterium]